MYTLLSAFKQTVKGMSGAISKRNVHYEVLNRESKITLIMYFTFCFQANSKVFKMACMSVAISKRNVIMKCYL